MYFGDSISDPWVSRDDNDLHPCRRCGRVRQARKAWTFCKDCRAVDPEMCDVVANGVKVKTKFYDKEIEDERADERLSA